MSTKHNRKYNDINPDPNMIETTQMVADRKMIAPYDVVHQTTWVDIFHTLSNSSKWIFDPNKKSLIKEPYGIDAFTIKLLSEPECKKLIELTELYGYEDAGYAVDYRNNKRVIMSDKQFANKLYDRIKQCVPRKHWFGGYEWEISGLNERFRYCRYIKGQKFDIHCDASYYRSTTEQSFYTVNIYLNDGRTDFKGGRTLFYDDAEDIASSVVAETGLALIFQQHPQRIRHAGEILTDGVKHLMRTDVIYKMLEFEDESDYKQQNDTVNEELVSKTELDNGVMVEDGIDTDEEEEQIMERIGNMFDSDTDDDKDDNVQVMTTCLILIDQLLEIFNI